jgi:hypothetical protein
MTRTYSNEAPVDRTGRRKEVVYWPAVDERRKSGTDGRRFGDVKPPENENDEDESPAALSLRFAEIAQTVDAMRPRFEAEAAQWRARDEMEKIWDRPFPPLKPEDNLVEQIRSIWGMQA